VPQPAREEANLPWVGFHAFRHTCASMPFAEGRNAKQVQVRRGHHSPAFTLASYVHLLDGDIGAPLTLPKGANQSANMTHATQHHSQARHSRSSRNLAL
jgi:hypothetical protein